MSPTITFLSDYGQDDDFVGTCHGVMAGICPDARILDEKCWGLTKSIMAVKAAPAAH